MDTNVFRYVLEVDKCKNITLAAKHLFISQPALTKQLSKLEKELGFQLFDRAHTPITTTPQGELFLDFARRYQELEQDFQNDIALSRHTPAVPVRIATTHRGGGYAGIHTAAFMAAYPNICLEYLDTSARKCEELLEEEQVDLAIYTDPILSSKLEYMSFPLMITVGIGTNLSDYAKVFTNPAYILIIAATVIGAMIGTFLMGKLFGFYPVEGMLTAGLCMANGGGSGDVQCLGAAHRMELMSYAQISSRIGGAIMLVVASFFFGKFL